MEKDKDITKVIFRKFKDGEIIAFFPELAGSLSPYTCQNYMHIGQHGHGDANILDTKKATPEEYGDLKRELEVHFAYNFQIVHKFTRHHQKTREYEIKRLRGGK